MCETKNENSSNLLRGISENGGILFYGIDSTAVVRRMEQLHKTSAVTTAALGRLLTGASLMGSMLKDDGDSITLRVAGGGPTGTVVACTDGTGNVKGCIDHPLVELPAKANGHLDVGGAVGKDGVLTVIRDNRLQKEPTVGQVPLVSGEIAEDLTYYFATSEQVPSSVGLGVLMNKDNTVRQAGGFIIQLMPFCDEKVIEKLEQRLAEVNSVTAFLDEGLTPEQILEKLLGDMDLVINDTVPTQFYCNCSRERVSKALIAVGRKELNEMIQEAKPVELKCHFCNSAYEFSTEDLKELLRKSK